VALAQLFRVNQADVSDRLGRVEVEEDFVNERAAESSVAQCQVFERNESARVRNRSSSETPFCAAGTLSTLLDYHERQRRESGLHKIHSHRQKAMSLLAVRLT
jgi:hypothetical protein